MLALRVLLIVVGLALPPLIWTVVSGSYAEQPTAHLRGPEGLGAPAWTRPCRRPDRQAIRQPRWFVLSCRRVDGRVVYRQSRDPDGDGDAHLVVLAGTHLVVVKLPAAARPRDLPGIGARVRAAGVYGKGRWGLESIDVQP